MAFPYITLVSIFFFIVFSTKKDLFCECLAFTKTLTCEGVHGCNMQGSDQSYRIDNAELTSNNQLTFSTFDGNGNGISYSMGLVQKLTITEAVAISPSNHSHDIYWPIICAYICHMDDNCLNFGVVDNNQCKIFYSHAYVILESNNCKSWEVIEAEEPLLAPVQADENVALKKPTCASSLYKEMYSYYAVDGGLGTNVFANECSHSIDADPNWFAIDLKRLLKVKKVSILTRQEWNQAYRYQDTAVGVSEQTWPELDKKKDNFEFCGIYTNIPTGGNWFEIMCRDTLPPGRTVIIQGGSHGNQCLCEVQVFAQTG